MLTKSILTFAFTFSGVIQAAPLRYSSECF